MKKYLVGLCAILLAVGFSAFNVKLSTIYFRYDSAGVGNFNKSNVENEANWKKVTTPLTCNTNGKACEIEIQDFDLTDPTAATLAAAESTISVLGESALTNTAVIDVQKSGTPLGVFRNQP